MLYNDKEIKFIRLGLNPSAMGNEVETSATMLFRSLKDRGVSADAVISGNGTNPDMARVARLEQMLRSIEADNRALYTERNRLQNQLSQALSDKSDAYGKGYTKGYTDARDAFESHEPKREEEPKRDPERSGRSTRRAEFVPNEEQKAKKAQWERIAREYDGESEDFVLEFGKCRGQKLAIASLNWLEWAVKNIHDMPYTIEIIVDYLDQLRRNRR